MNADSLQKLREYWDSLRGDRIAPYRAELDPRKFEDVLLNMFILEQLNPSQIRVRLAGMALCEMMGMEVRGMPPEAFISAEQRPEFAQHLDTVLSGPAVVELDLSTESLDGDQVAAQMLLLPLRSDFGEVTRILGCVIADSPSMRTPVNFQILDQRISTISVPHPSPLQDGAMAGFGEPGATFTPTGTPQLRAVEGNPSAPQGDRRRGHLKLVRGRGKD